MLLSVWRIMLGIWLSSVLLVISLPWSKFDAHPHWKNVQLVPFRHLSLHPTILFEIALNIVAFIPVGYLTVRSFSHTNRNPIVGTLLLGFCSSVSIEFYQLFCYDRVPSTTDIFMNVTGTAVGVWLAFALDHIFTFCAIRLRRLSA